MPENNVTTDQITSKTKTTYEFFENLGARTFVVWIACFILTITIIFSFNTSHVALLLFKAIALFNFSIVSIAFIYAHKAHKIAEVEKGVVNE